MPAHGFNRGFNDGFGPSRGGELVLRCATDGPDPAYQDGDPVLVLTKEAVRHRNASALSRAHLEGFNSDGLRPDGLAKAVCELVCQYRFERISQNQVRRTEIATNDVRVYGPTPHPEDGQTFEPTYVRVAMRSDKHRVFGTKNNEIWYGGREDWTAKPTLDAIWTAIETQTPNQESDYLLWPATPVELRRTLWLRTNPPTDTDLHAILAPDVDVGPSPVNTTIVAVLPNTPTTGVHTCTVTVAVDLAATDSRFLVDSRGHRFEIYKASSTPLSLIVDSRDLQSIVPTTGTAAVGDFRLVRRRRNRVDWRGLHGMTANLISDITDKRKLVDLRTTRTHVHQFVVAAK